MNTATIDNIRLQVNTKLDPKNKSKLGQFMTPSVIAWETEVWIADAPTHMIHFNGSRFLGPYNQN